MIQSKTNVHPSKPSLPVIGVKLRKVDIAIDELIDGCLVKGKPVNGEARAEFTAHKCRELDQRRRLHDFVD